MVPIDHDASAYPADPAAMRRRAALGRAWRVLALFTLVGAVTGAAGCAPRGTARPAAGGPRVEGPRLNFKERAHDFGKISTAKKTEYRFVFTNVGTQPVEIGEVRPEPATPGT